MYAGEGAHGWMTLCAMPAGIEHKAKA